MFLKDWVCWNLHAVFCFLLFLFWCSCSRNRQTNWDTIRRVHYANLLNGLVRQTAPYGPDGPQPRTQRDRNRVPTTDRQEPATTSTTSRNA
jgi:hypothetical protein